MMQGRIISLEEAEDKRKLAALTHDSENANALNATHTSTETKEGKDTHEEEDEEPIDEQV